jgi:hypothetical protein
MRPFFNGPEQEGRERFASFLSIREDIGFMHPGKSLILHRLTEHIVDQTKEIPYELMNAQQVEYFPMVFLATN